MRRVRSRAQRALRHGWPAVLAATIVAAASGAAAGSLPETSLAYTIDAQLDPETRQLDGTVTVSWVNLFDVAVDEVPVHLYLNAFAHEGTTFLRESPPSARRNHAEVLERYDDPWGWTELTEVMQLGDDAGRCSVTAWQPDDGNPADESLVKIKLARPVAPGETMRMRLAFEARLPIPMARTGGYEDYFFVAQWFPKLSGIQGGEWAPAQFHRATEFFANFADFDVRLSVPEGWTVAATGELEVGEGGSVRARQRAVHDFAFLVAHDLREMRSEVGGVELRVVYPPGVDRLAERIRGSLEVGLRVLQQRVGPYPYSTLTIVLPTWRGRRTSGMEYPTLITGFPGDPLFEMGAVESMLLAESVAVHELAHQYFYGLVATDERREAFLDEGFTSYWEGEILEAMEDRKRPTVGSVFGRRLDWSYLHAGGLRHLTPGEAVAQRPSWLFRPGTEGRQIYSRTALTLRAAEARFGESQLDAVFQAYFRKYAFGHPTAADFLRVASEVGGADLEAFLREAWSQTSAPNFRVAHARSAPWKPPRGWVRGPERSRVEKPAAAPALGADGRVEVRAPGYVRDGGATDGSVALRQLQTVQEGADAGDTWFVSEVRVDGPGWDHLPVIVTFEFEDGAVLEDRWDGRASWRSWRAVRRSPLRRVLLRGGSLELDFNPADNGLAVRADPAFRTHWAGFAAALGSWLGVGAGLWL